MSTPIFLFTYTITRMDRKKKIGRKSIGPEQRARAQTLFVQQYKTFRDYVPFRPEYITSRRIKHIMVFGLMAAARLMALICARTDANQNATRIRSRATD